MGSLSLITTTATRRRLIFVPAVTRQQKQHGQGPEWGRFLRGAAPDVQGLLQVDGHQQGRDPGQERPPWSFRQRRCPHVRVRAGQPNWWRGRWCLHLRQHGQDVPGEDRRQGGGEEGRGGPRTRGGGSRGGGRGGCQEEEEGRQVNVSQSTFQINTTSLFLNCHKL